MAQYRVECTGDVREVYIVDADSPEEAMENWHAGHLYVSEASGVEPVSAELDE
jgi:hypothetical protein